MFDPSKRIEQVFEETPEQTESTDDEKPNNNENVAITPENLVEAIKAGKVEKAKELLDKGMDVNTEIEPGVIPLHIALEEILPRSVAEPRIPLNMLELLLEKKADVNKIHRPFSKKKGPPLELPLYTAVCYGHTPTVELLLKAKADVNMPVRTTGVGILEMVKKIFFQEVLNPKQENNYHDIISLLQEAKNKEAKLKPKSSRQNGEEEPYTKQPKIKNIPQQKSPREQFDDACKKRNKNDINRLLQKEPTLLTVDNIVASLEFGVEEGVFSALKKKYKQENDWRKNYETRLAELQDVVALKLKDTSITDKKLRQRWQAANKYLEEQLRSLQEKQNSKEDVVIKNPLNDTERLREKIKQQKEDIVRKTESWKLKIKKSSLKENQKANPRSTLNSWEKIAQDKAKLALGDCSEDDLRKDSEELEKIVNKLVGFKLPHENNWQQAPANNGQRNNRNRQQNKPAPRSREPGSKRQALPRRQVTASALPKAAHGVEEKKPIKPPELKHKPGDAEVKQISPATLKQHPVDRLHVELMHLITWHKSVEEAKSTNSESAFRNSLVGLQCLREVLALTVTCTRNNPDGFFIVDKTDQANFDKQLRFYEWMLAVKRYSLQQRDGGIEYDLPALIKSTVAHCLAPDGLVKKLLHSLRGTEHSVTSAWSEQQYKTLYAALYPLLEKSDPIRFDENDRVLPTPKYPLTETELSKKLTEFVENHQDNTPLATQHVRLIWVILEDIVKFYQEQLDAIQKFMSDFSTGWDHLGEPKEERPYLQAIGALRQLSALIQLCGGQIATDYHGKFKSFVDACRDYASGVAHRRIIPLDVERLLEICSLACQTYNQLSQKPRVTASFRSSLPMTSSQRNYSSLTDSQGFLPPPKPPKIQTPAPSIQSPETPVVLNREGDPGL